MTEPNENDIEALAQMLTGNSATQQSVTHVARHAAILEVLVRAGLTDEVEFERLVAKHMAQADQVVEQEAREFAKQILEKDPNAGFRVRVLGAVPFSF